MRGYFTFNVGHVDCKDKEVKMKRKKGKGEKREGGKRESESGTLVGLNDLTADWDLVPYLDIIISYGFYHSSLSYTHIHHTLYYSTTITTTTLVFQ